jgi:hypothetical protein
VEKVVGHQDPPGSLHFFDVGFVECVRSIIIVRWNGFDTPLHTLAHASNPKFYDELIAQSNGKRKALHKDKEVANGVKEILPKVVSNIYAN